MSVDKVTTPIANGDSVALVQGQILRISAANGARRAQADAPENVVGTIGVADTGANVGATFNAVVAGTALALMEPGLTLVAGDPIYISATSPGRGTNVAPDDNSVFVGTVKAFLNYATTRLVTAVIQPARAAASSSNPFRMTVTNGEESNLTAGMVVWSASGSNTAKKATSQFPVDFRGVIGVVPSDSFIAPGEQGEIIIGGPAQVQLEEGPQSTIGDMVFVSNSTPGYAKTQTDGTPPNQIPFAVTVGDVTGNEQVPILITGVDQRGAPNSINGYALRNGAVPVFIGAGVDASGGAAPATFTGVAVGDRVQRVINLTTPGDVSSAFLGTVTVADQIEQGNTDLSAQVLLAFILPAFPT